jgi:arginyl-tRNA synthetase
MKSIKDQLTEQFKRAIVSALGVETDPLLGPAQNQKFGDYQSNAAMGLAKTLKERVEGAKNPRAVAEAIKQKLELGSMASEVSIAGPGFINVKLNPAWLAEQFSAALGDARLGLERTVAPQRIVVDYSAPNVAKEMHVGHIRSTGIGDVFARIFEFLGHHVIRQNHLGDWGTQFGMLLRYLRDADSGEAVDIKDLEGFYRAAKKRFDEDPKFADEARAMVVRLQAREPEVLKLWERIVETSRETFEKSYRRFNVKLTRADECGESFYNPFLADVVAELQQKGVAVEDQGAIVVWVEGFAAPLIIRKKDGGFGYGTTDLAAIRYRVQTLKAQRLIYVTDARQEQHFKQFLDGARRAGWIKDVQVDHVAFGTILGPDGTPFKTRTGGTVLLRDVLDEAESRALKLVEDKLQSRNTGMSEEEKKNIARAVGIGAIKYFDLNRDTINNYVFDWDKMLSLDGNTAPYLQYAHARMSSIFDKGREQGIQRNNTPVILETEAELALVKHLLAFSDVVATVSEKLKPHHLTTYLYDLATTFSVFYEKCPVLQSAEPLRASRLAICELTAKTLASGLDLLGIEHPQRM